MRTHAILPLIMFAVACQTDRDRTEDPAGPGELSLALELSRLPRLGERAVYEGWLIVEGEPVSSGRFAVAEDGTANPDVFAVDAALAGAAAFVLTIEPAADDDPGPSMTKLLAGDLRDGIAELGIEHEAALGTDFADVAGAYLLATPTTMANVADNDQGIWWLTGMPPQPTLVLPPLPPGFRYEGWVVSDAGPVTTGKLDGGSGADSDGAGPTAGPDPFPPFPGQDFIEPPMSLPGGMAVITVEPEPDV
jgi:hypothetical protein